jgi:hypothetical protein
MHGIRPFLLASRTGDLKNAVRRSNQTGNVVEWRIERERGVDTSPGRDTESAFTFLPSSNGEEAQTTVEYATGSGLGSMSAARDALRPYLDRDRPTRRLIVACNGMVSDAEE